MIPLILQLGTEEQKQKYLPKACHEWVGPVSSKLFGTGSSDLICCSLVTRIFESFDIHFQLHITLHSTRVLCRENRFISIFLPLVPNLQNFSLVKKFLYFVTFYFILLSHGIQFCSYLQVGSFCLSESGLGSDAFGMKTLAKADGDDFLITGTKLWITNAGHAHFFLVRFYQSTLYKIAMYKNGTFCDFYFQRDLEFFIFSFLSVAFRCLRMPIHQRVIKALHASLLTEIRKV